jgi:hypothetical protein
MRTNLRVLVKEITYIVWDDLCIGSLQKKSQEFYRWNDELANRNVPSLAQYSGLQKEKFLSTMVRKDKAAKEQHYEY